MSVRYHTEWNISPPLCDTLGRRLTFLSLRWVATLDMFFECCNEAGYSANGQKANIASGTIEFGHVRQLENQPRF
jgi:hypothetical protein